MRRIHRFAICLFVGLFWTHDAPAFSLDNDTLHVGVHYAPPLSDLDDDGHPYGFCIDLMDVLAQKVGWHIVYHYATWPEAVKQLQRGETQLILPLLKRPERLSIYDFSQESIFTSWGGVVSRKGLHLESVLDLEGKAIGGVQDDAFLKNLLDLINGFGLRYTVTTYETSGDVYRSLTQGKIDAGAIERLDIHYNAPRFDAEETGIVYSPSPAFMAVLKGQSGELLARLDQELTSMKAVETSDYHRLYSQYFGESVAFRLPRWLVLLLEIGGLMLVVLLSFILTLNRQVRLKTQELAEKNRQLESEVAERVLAEKRIQASLDEKTVLLKEIHHRVKNNLQIISSLLNLQSVSIKDPQVTQIFREGQQRIRTIALIHETLYRSSDFSHIAFEPFAQSLVQNLYMTYWHGRGAIDIRVETEVESLSLDTAIPCGLIVTELVSNAFKYAFIDGFEGDRSLAIALRRYTEQPGYDLELMVADNGVGLSGDVDVETSDSLGLRLITILAQEQLGGRMQILRNPGTAFNIQFPLRGERTT